MQRFPKNGVLYSIYCCTLCSEFIAHINVQAFFFLRARWRAAVAHLWHRTNYQNATNIKVTRSKLPYHVPKTITMCMFTNFSYIVNKNICTHLVCLFVRFICSINVKMVCMASICRWTHDQTNRCTATKQTKYDH